MNEQTDGETDYRKLSEKKSFLEERFTVPYPAI